MFALTPDSISPHVQDFCRRISPGGMPVYITITPDSGCEVNDCFECVRQKVARAGGRIQFGWSIWEWPRVYVEAEHHAVYERPTGPPWLDITPSELPVAKRLFLPDDTAVYDFNNEGVLRDNERLALCDDPLIQVFFAAAKERAEIINRIPGVNVTAEDVDEETLEKLAKAEDKLSQAMMQLATKFGF